MSPVTSQDSSIASVVLLNNGSNSLVVASGNNPQIFGTGGSLTLTPNATPYSVKYGNDVVATLNYASASTIIFNKGQPIPGASFQITIATDDN